MHVLDFVKLLVERLRHIIYVKVVMFKYCFEHQSKWQHMLIGICQLAQSIQGVIEPMLAQRRLIFV